jgi:hypothetical protein
MDVDRDDPTPVDKPNTLWENANAHSSASVTGSQETNRGGPQPRGSKSKFSLGDTVDNPILLDMLPAKSRLIGSQLVELIDLSIDAVRVINYIFEFSSQL